MELAGLTLAVYCCDICISAGEDGCSRWPPEIPVSTVWLVVWI